MMNKARIINIIKNAVIVILSLSAVFLLLLSLNVSPASLIKSLAGGSGNTVVSSGTEGLSSVTTSSPYLILLTDEYGSHHAAKYDNQAKTKVFSQLSATLGEALGSASGLSQITESDWQAALMSTGVFFDYLYPQPLSFIALQLGTQTPESLPDITARRLCLAQNGDSLCLYFINAVTGEHYRLITALKDDSFSPRISDADLPEASFAFESGAELARYDPYFVFSGESLSISAAQSVSPLLSSAETTVSLNDFSMNERTSRSFTESDDTVVHVDGNMTLRVNPSGTVLFTATGSDGIPISYSGDAPSPDDCVMSAASLISKTIGVSAGDAEIGLTGTEEKSDSGGCTLMFGYYVNGIPVLLSSTGWCAKIDISGGKIVRAELNYREYSIQDDLLLSIPEKEAAIISVIREGSPLLLYVDAGGALAASWYRLQDVK